MDTKFNLIKTASSKIAAEQKQTSLIQENFALIAAQGSTTANDLFESVTHVLSNIAVTASSGKPLKLMHTDAIASFMAGVEAIAQALPSSTDQAKKENTLRALAASAVRPDGTVSFAVTPIAQLGARKESLRTKYAKLVHAYVSSTSSGTPAGEPLARAARQLQTMIDRAMRVAGNPSQEKSGGMATA